MKNAGYGGLIVGKHYQIKQKEADEHQEHLKYAKWLEAYNKKVAEERIRRQQREYKQTLIRDAQGEAKARAAKQAVLLKRMQKEGKSPEQIKVATEKQMRAGPGSSDGDGSYDRGSTERQQKKGSSVIPQSLKDMIALNLKTQLAAEQHNYD